MSQALRKLTATIGKSKTILIFINQIRMKIGVMFGNPETTTGGNALKFYSSVRLDVRKTETIEVSKDVDAIGNRVRVKVVKNKVAPPFRRIDLELIFGKGISAIGSLLDCAVKYDIIKKSGAWYSYNEEKIAQGKDSAREYLEQHPDFARDLEIRLRQQIFPGREQSGGKADASAGTAAKKAAKAADSPAADADDAPETAGSAAAMAAAAGDASAVAEPSPVYHAPASQPPAKAGPGRPRKAVPSGSVEDALF
jgi:recombination protein RecA